MFSHSPFVPVADRVWLAVAEPATVTVGLVAGEHGALMVDTGSSPQQGRSLRRAAEEVCGLAVNHAVITHAHWDHWFGLAGLQDVTSWGHPRLARAQRQDDEPAKLGVRDEQMVMPDRLVVGPVEIDLGGRLARLWHPGLGHTCCDVVVEVPDARVLFAGDLLESVGQPQAGPDAVPEAWPTTLDALLVGREDWLFVPGHGPVMSHAHAREQRDSLIVS